MKKIIAILAPLMIFAGVAANAYNFSEVKIEQWVGSGRNSAVVVVDFNEKSFAFGYRWDGDASGRDALTAIDNATSLDSHVGAYGLTDAISYGGYSKSYNSYKYDPTSSWWEYFTSSNGESWESSWDGASDRALSDGAWDGWRWSPPYPGDGGVPVTPVPEPSSVLALCSLIGLAGSAKLLSFRRK